MLGSDSGVLVGHWTDEVARTGCTVVVLPEGAVTSGEVRGGAPASRDFGLLEPQRTVTAVDAVVLTGGSAFGLAAVDGVMTWCEEQGRGFQTRAGRVPIVVGLALYDLAEGDSTVRPQPEAGYAAAQTARAQMPQLGRVGAGAGATMNKWRGPEHRKPGGLGGAVVQVGDVKVGALVAVNAAGDLNDGSVVAELVAGTYEHQVVDPFVASADGAGCSTGNGAGDSAVSSTEVAATDEPASKPGSALDCTNTTIGVVVTNAAVDKLDCYLLAGTGHTGMARALFPVHTQSDGDALVVAATGEVEAHHPLLGVMVAAAVEQAIRSV